MEQIDGNNVLAQALKKQVSNWSCYHSKGQNKT